MRSIVTGIYKITTSCGAKETVARICIIALFGLLAYSNTFNMSFNFDDAANIVNNPLIREFNVDGIKQAFQSRRGVGVVSFQLNYYLSGLEMPGFHAVNLLIHLANSLLVYSLLALMLRTPAFASSRLKGLPIPFFTALIFVAHPLQTQAVTYIVQRFTSMATMFYLAALVAYLQGRLDQNGKGRAITAGSFAWYSACILALFCALNSKEIAYTLPLAIILVEGICFRISWKSMLSAAILAGSAGFAILLKFGMGGHSLEQAMFAMDEATRLQTIISRGDYLLTQFRVIVTYIRLLFLPVNQSVEYDISLSRSLFEPAVLGSLLILFSLLCFAVFLMRKSRGGDGATRLVAFGIFWFFLTLSVESSILPIIDLIFEHRVYLPSVGAITAVITPLIAYAWRGGFESRKGAACTALLLIALFFVGATWKRNLVWRSEVTLWEDATTKKPNSSRAWNNLGGAYIKSRQPDKALRALVRAIELDPSKAAAWNNVGIAIDIMGAYRDRFNKTREMFDSPRAVEREHMSRWLGDVNNNLGLAYEILGNLPKAAEFYRNAVGYYPSLGVAYYNLGLVSAAMGDYDRYMEQQQILLLVAPPLADRLQARVGRR